MDEPEIVLNLWYIIDEGTGYAYCLLARAYAMAGTDTEKLERLKQLAPTDYLMAERLGVPDNFRVVLPDGKKMKGYASAGDIKENMGWIYEKLYRLIEERMPRIMRFNDGEPFALKQNIPQNHLWVCTALIEDAEGIITPKLPKY